MSDVPLRDLFERLVGLDEAGRADTLAEIKFQNEELHQRLLELLELDDVSVLWDGLSEQAGSDQKLTIGAYRTVSLISDGAASQVYLAESLKDQRERVAIKVLQPNANDPGFAARFLRECEALHRIDHPSVVRMLEFGWLPESASDRPYIVMELIDGTRLTDHLASESLQLVEKTELIRALADGLQHIHLNHIVHRDLKPSNIMIDKDGKPKIIDFGVAIVHSESGEKPDFRTLTGQITGTPRYMSPEQILGNHVDSRSDIYSLGVVSYEMLCGAHPHNLGRVPITRLSEIVCNTPAAPLSKHATETRGPLSSVIGKCLEHNPDHRYPSAAALGMDLRSVQLGLPVSSAPTLSLSKITRYALRHPRMTKTIGLLTLLIFSSSIAFGVRSNQLLRTSQRLSSFETANTDSADLLRMLLAGGFTDGEPVHTEYHLVLLDKLLQNIDEIRISEIARAQARGAIVESYSLINENERVLELYPQVIREHERVFGKSDSRTLLQMLRYAKKLQRADRTNEAELTIAECVERASAVEGDPDISGRIHYALGEIRYGQQRFEEALVSYGRAETLLAKATESREAELLHIYAMYGVAVSHRDLGQLELARLQLERVLTMSVGRFGSDDRRTRTTRQLLEEIQEQMEEPRTHPESDP